MTRVPRRSPEHLAARREQVLHAALRCFARDGFHATSMATVVAESGMSAGAVYRYFPSKAELVAAVAEGVMSQVVSTVDEVLEEPEPVAPAEALRLLLHRALAYATSSEVDLTRVAVTAWGEALRDEALLERVGGFYRLIREDLRRVAERWQQAGHLDPAADLEAVGQALFSAVPGFLLQRLVLGDVDVDRYCDGWAALLGSTPAAGGRAGGTAG